MAVDLSSLKNKKQEYVTQQAEKIAQDMVDRGVITSKLETCDLPFYGWDTELHNNMSSICAELRKMGISSSSKVNWGVTSGKLSHMDNWINFVQAFQLRNYRIEYKRFIK